MTTHIVKWKDDDRRLTAFCDDDKTETEIGPVKWNDATNQLELHCGGNVYPVKWNDADNRLEVRNVNADCCCEYTNNCGSCYLANQTPKYLKVTFSGVTDCGICCDWADGDFILTIDTVCFWTWTQWAATPCGPKWVTVDLYKLNGSSYITEIYAYRDTGMFQDAVCFESLITEPSCSDGDSFNNALVDCGSTPRGPYLNPSTAGYGGTAITTISCLGT